MDKKIRVLYIVPSLKIYDGVASYAMNYFRNIDKEKIQIDFVIGINERSVYFDEIEKCGSKIFYIPKIGIKNGIKTIKKIKTFLKENAKNYDIIHCHVLNMGAFYLHYAKKYGIKVRILHSHVTKTADSKLHEIRNKVLLPYAIKNANYYCACSKDAGDKIFINKAVHVIKNAINGKRFEYNQNVRDELRKYYGIEKDTFVIGNVGRLCNQKNQKFLIKIFKEINKKVKNSKLIIVGNGPLEYELKKIVKENSLEKDILFLEPMNNIEKIYQIFDVFVLPSIYEGLGIVLLEAQISGLPCVASDVVPEEAQISELYKKISLNDTVENWVENIINSKVINRKTNLNGLIDNNYEIETEAKKLMEYYNQLLKEEN